MGCVGSKRSELLQEELESQKSKASISSTKRSSFASGRLKYIEVIGDGVGVKEREKIKSNGGSDLRNSWSWEERKEKHGNPNPNNPVLNPRFANPPKHSEGEYVAAGWPTWLSSVAGEAIRGWIPRRADSFEKLDKIGQGTYSNVYKARDLETGKIVALKKVRFDNLEPESVRFMAREIQVLRRLDHPNIIKLEGLVTSRMSCSLYLVFEYMEHDLAGLASSPGIKFSEPQVKCYLQQILRGLDHCHNRGVLHRDIKGSNLLLDNSGILKIADFGLATFFCPDQRQPLTSRVVTLWYRPPELLLGATEYGVGVDLWSTGCILAELLAGKPIMPGRTEVEQLHKIFKLCGSPSEEYWRKSKLPHATIFKPKQPYKRSIAETFRDFPPSALASLETLLAIEPADRGTAAKSLKSEFFTTKPFACDPSVLPRYPPSKEFDAKLRDEEARRQRAAGGRVQGGDGRRVSRAVPAPDANAELAASIQKRRQVSYTVKSQSEKFNGRQDDSAVGFRIDPPHMAEGSAIFGNLGPAVNPSSAIRKQDEIQSMDFSRPMHRSSNRSSSSMRNSIGGLPNLSGVARNSEEPFRQQDISRQTATFGSTKIDKYEHAEEQRQPEPFHKGGTHAPQERPNFGGGQAGHIHFSGPLLHPSSNLDDILGQHEKQIQQAVRRSRQYSNGAWPNVSHQNHGPLPVRRRRQSRGEIVELSEGEQGLPALVEKPETEHEV